VEQVRAGAVELAHASVAGCERNFEDGEVGVVEEAAREVRAR
jgi:hypothetical protein